MEPKMPNPEQPDAQEIGTRLKSLIDYVQDCERRVLRGEIVDMQGLDRNVADVCTSLTALPRTDARNLEERMSMLVEKLGELAGAMREQQEKIKAKA
jgi:hypothetical protein